MTERKIPVTDKRVAPDDEVSSSSDPLVDPAVEETVEERDYLGDLQRLQAEFDNYRKRMMKEQTALTSRATAQFITRLLPVLDNFERAIAHGEGGEGVALVFKSLRETLESEGLSEIPAKGVPFDPTVHEAVQSHEADVEQPIVESLFRRGYTLGDKVIRPAMVVVARPHDAPARVVEEAGTDDGSA
ncbi:MAG: molecular chaperone GrpE [Actinomycetota bacterium]|jgi:molecular chaperone GrpE|nr:molecular chaperone GrpE [Actinomycetota bacterium]